MVGCAAFGCSNRSEQGFSMRVFPKDVARRNYWIAEVKREGWKPTRSSAICEVHFEDSMWEKTRVDGSRKLKCNAVPTIFSFTPKKKLRKPSKIKPHTCKICNYSYAQAGGLKRHLLTHTGSPHTCKICNCSYTRAASLKRHLLKHNEEQLYTCKICNYSCLVASNLTKHLSTHTGQICKPSKNSFSDGATLKINLHTHTETTPTQDNDFHNDTIIKKEWIVDEYNNMDSIKQLPANDEFKLQPDILQHYSCNIKQEELILKQELESDEDL